MGRCKNCKLYDPLLLPQADYEKRQGKCKWLNELCGHEDNGAFTEYGDAELIVGENFGCVHFEMK